MKQRRLAVLAATAAMPLALVGIASATSPPAVTPVEHVRGADLADDLKVNADGVKFQTKVPTDVSVLTLTIDPGATTGWHTHPGLAIIAVSEGTGTLYSPDCTSETFNAGEAFVEAGDDAPTMFTNESPSPVVLTVSFIAPRDADPVHPEAGPACG
ncbi:MAG: cupin domain-containing protein [Solirubrobacteraceae bacterium]